MKTTTMKTSTEVLPFYRRSLDILPDRIVRQSIELGVVDIEVGHPHRAARRRLFDDWRIVRSAMLAVWPDWDRGDIETVEELAVAFETADAQLPTASDRIRMRLAFYTLHEFLLEVAVTFEQQIERSRETAS